MAKYANGTNYAKYIDPTPENILDQGMFNGKVRVMQDYYALAGDLLSGNYIVMGGKLPTGSQVVDIILTGGTNLVTASSLFIVGDEGDDNRYITSILLTTGGVNVGPNVATGMCYQVTGITDNYIRVACNDAALSLISGGTIRISVMYVVE